ncbi:hypothetical protein GobsT_59120 [Gemmata obscuriglobus]|uniref:MoaD/ThiS family protein n=1 Tax=Gemmata obscuriglobus TaxID=114 RepID=A0A2Z3H5R6_9BACT|nr:hypothetical protein [Gemmata obscuriglobus]AWM36300.1 hypothetical protein C1280_04240 [Gemmata obscuriglobus]QEG31091.1 hypothetical protein GobsT_59120 [Gemmata obscuriglobus]VTS10428.1 unnamed protein product [Gemmata obscuriglobus UQM 2246]
MPTVLLPNVYFSPEQQGHKAAEVRVAAKTWAAIYHELAARFPSLSERLIDADGNPHGWFELYRDSDGESLRYDPDAVHGDDELLVLIYAVGD